MSVNDSKTIDSANHKPYPKDLSLPIEDTYDPKCVEKDIATWWEESQFYHPDAKSSKDVSAENKFVMMMPPPNVTGSLHLGHTLMCAVEDMLTRWNRMRGRQTLWLPGLDHAGIATQSVVEKKLLREEGKTRHDLGRDEFIKKVWEWKNNSSCIIETQFRRLGVSCDWQRQVFTMDEKLSRAVSTAFIILFEKGIIHRKNRLVSWCCHLQTALSDIEIDTMEVEKVERIRIPSMDKTVEVGVLWYFKYEVKEFPGEYIEVATTRIETMLGDVAVAVNPKDTRYTKYVGCHLIHPYFDDRGMVVIADDYVSLDYGTGAVKITPAHDKNDYEIGERHKLPSVSCFDESGNISIGPFAGMHRFECRVTIEKDLESKNLFVKKGPNTNKMSIPICSRSGDVMEYMLKPQWYMDCNSAADHSLKAVASGELKIEPAGFVHTWNSWLGDIREWCISRQLWWGHQIPCYRVTKPEQEEEVWVAATTEDEAIEKAKMKLNIETGIEVVRDEDVLDTWFSSGLFPFSSLGWPDKTDDLEAFFPGSLLETGHDILFFWVARMTMMSYLLTGKLPFHTIYLHPMVRDCHGKKMSKSVGNVVDPIDCMNGITLETMQDQLKNNSAIEPKELKRAVDALKKDFPKGIPECGADGLRMGLLAYVKQGRSVNMDVQRVVAYRNFCNKLWNMTRFALIYFEDDRDTFIPKGIEQCKLNFFDKYILQELKFVNELVDKSMNSYELADCVDALYSFVLDKVCAVYLETLKVRFRGSNQADKMVAKEVLYMLLDSIMRLLHPIMPYVTEVLYHRLPGPSSNRVVSISIAEYPTGGNFISDTDSSDIMWKVNLFNDIVTQIRSMKSLLQMDTNTSLKIFFVAADKEVSEFLENVCDFVTFLCKVATRQDAQKCVVEKEDLPVRSLIDTIPHSSEVMVALVCPDDADFGKVVKSLDKRVDLMKKSLVSLTKKMGASSYQDRVPEDIRKADDIKLIELKKSIAGIEGSMSKINMLINL